MIIQLFGENREKMGGTKMKREIFRKSILVVIIFSMITTMFSGMTNVKAKEKMIEIQINNTWVQHSLNDEVAYHTFSLQDDGIVTMGIRSYGLEGDFQIVELENDNMKYCTIPVFCSGSSGKVCERSYSYKLTAGNYAVLVGDSWKEYNGDGWRGKYELKLKFEKCDLSKSDNSAQELKENQDVSGVFLNQREDSRNVVVYDFKIEKEKDIDLTLTTEMPYWSMVVKNKKTGECIVWSEETYRTRSWGLNKLNKGEYRVSFSSEYKGKYNICLISIPQNTKVVLTAKRINMKPGQSKNIFKCFSPQNINCYDRLYLYFERVLGEGGNVTVDVDHDYGTVEAIRYGCDWIEVYGEKCLVMVMPPKPVLKAKKEIYTYPSGYKDRRIDCSVKTKGKKSLWWNVDYQYACSTSPKFPKGKTKYSDDGWFPKINLNKKYYVKVRPYVIDYSFKKAKLYYGTWSKVKVLK